MSLEQYWTLELNLSNTLARTNGGLIPVFGWDDEYLTPDDGCFLLVQTPFQSGAFDCVDQFAVVPDRREQVIWSRLAKLGLQVDMGSYLQELQDFAGRVLVLGQLLVRNIQDRTEFSFGIFECWLEIRQAICIFDGCCYIERETR